MVHDICGACHIWYITHMVHGAYGAWRMVHVMWCTTLPFPCACCHLLLLRLLLWQEDELPCIAHTSAAERRHRVQPMHVQPCHRVQPMHNIAAPCCTLAMQCNAPRWPCQVASAAIEMAQQMASEGVRPRAASLGSGWRLSANNMLRGLAHLPDADVDGLYRELVLEQALPPIESTTREDRRHQVSPLRDRVPGPPRVPPQLCQAIIPGHTLVSPL